MSEPGACEVMTVEFWGHPDAEFCLTHGDYVSWCPDVTTPAHSAERAPVTEDARTPSPDTPPTPRP